MIMDSYFPYFPNAIKIFFLDFKLYPDLYKHNSQLGQQQQNTTDWLP